MHEDNRHSDTRVLEFGLPYLLRHNKDHTKDIEKWIKTAKVADCHGTAQDLRKILELSQEITNYLETALEKLTEQK